MVTKVIRKTFVIRESGRSTDFITPSFGYGCLYNCSYCYMKRHLPVGLTVAKNINDILTAVNTHSIWLEPKVPNQTDNVYYTYDISCNEDFALHLKYYNWERIFDFFKDNDKIKGSFATKTVPITLLGYNSNKKIRIRFSLMPQNVSTIVEPNTSKIIDRIKAINTFIEAGYEVHINFSPVIVYTDWLQDYADLFKLVDKYVHYKKEVKAEVIFLTHNEGKHIYNLKNKISGEHLLYNPAIQEGKVSQYGGSNLRYKRQLKTNWIKQFTQLHDSIIQWNTIRYIF